VVVVLAGYYSQSLQYHPSYRSEEEEEGDYIDHLGYCLHFVSYLLDLVVHYTKDLVDKCLEVFNRLCFFLSFLLSNNHVTSTATAACIYKSLHIPC
jgi:hypothetical protein